MPTPRLEMTKIVGMWNLEWNQNKSADEGRQSRPLRPKRDAMHASMIARVVLVVVCLVGGIVFPTVTCAQVAPSAEGVEFFEKHIRPIFVEHCYECHSTLSDGGLSLNSRLGWLQGGDSGPALVPGDPEASLLIEAVRYQNRDFQMPPQNRLEAAQIQALETWVAMGAPDPRSESTSTKAPTGMAIDEGHSFWSFRPVADPSVPVVSDSTWVRTPIDAFILSQLESRDLTPAPPAERRVLIRRLCMNLIGIPPTPEQVQRYVADPSPLATKRLIDRLLDSPLYGERWGRHWLDVARYADSNGLDENLAFGNAWRYRDYVIDAFNRDKPFDRFLIEQLAGDLLPDASRETRIATGFLVLGAKVLAEPDREKLAMDTIDEQLDATGKAFLGMTFGCVRCHDHKFDPIKQRDYYALGAIFKSTKTLGDTNTGAIKHWHEHVFASEDELKELEAVDAEIARLKKQATTFKNDAMAKVRDEARAHAVDYLVASTQFGIDDPLTHIAEIAKERRLHPRILHHCRRHLEYNADDPVFEPWHRLRIESGDVLQHQQAVDVFYRPLFAAAEENVEPKTPPNVTSDSGSSDADLATDETVSKLPALVDLSAVDLSAVRTALRDNSGFLATPPKPEFAFDEATLAEYDRLMEVARLHESQAQDVPSAMGVCDGELHTRLPIHIRGSHLSLGEPVPREFPEVMRTTDVRPVFPSNQSGRLELARWMASTQHPLTARVYVNRIWRWHFGEGLVRSTENFGVLGDRPSHPKLLDWLARRFMASGWSTKELHRLILASSVYQMSSLHPDAEYGSSVDPENRFLWRFRLQRLESEQLRDSILAVSGRLDTRMAGKTVPLRNRQFVFNHTSVDHTRYDSLRRAIYLPVIRNNLYTLFEQFDFPDPTMPTGDRNATVVAPQSLLLMNSDLVMDSSHQLARNLKRMSASDASIIEAAYMRVLGREPTESETKRAMNFMEEVIQDAGVVLESVDPSVSLRAWSLFCQSLFASNEFMYLR